MNAEDKRITWHVVLIGIAVLIAIPPLGWDATPEENKGGFNGMSAIIGWCLLAVPAAIASGVGTVAAFKLSHGILSPFGLDTLAALIVSLAITVATIAVGLQIVVRSCPPWAGGG